MNCSFNIRSNTVLLMASPITNLNVDSTVTQRLLFGENLLWYEPPKRHSSKTLCKRYITI